MRFAYLSFDAGVPVFGTGGSSVHMRNVVQSLGRIGHDVRVYAVATGEMASAPTSLRSPVHHITADGFADQLNSAVASEDHLPEHLSSEWRSLFTAERAQRQLARELAAFQPDAIYERYSLFGYAGAELARQFGVPFLLEVNAPLCQEQQTYRKLVLRQTAAEMERTIFGAADMVLAVSAPLAEHAMQLGVAPDRVTVMPNAVDPDLFDPDVSPEIVRTRYGLDEKSVIGFVGSLKPWHDLTTLVAAVDLVSAADPSIHLLIVGDGPGRSSGSPNVTFTGAVGHDEVPAHLAAMDIVVVPYPAGGETYFSPLKLFEAMAMAKPVVGARVGQVDEVLTEGVTGEFYDPGNAADLAATLLDVLGREDRGRALGTAARNWIIADRTWDDNARRIEEIAARRDRRTLTS